MLVAQIAEKRLDPGVKQKVDALISQVEFPGLAYNFETVACWMDDIRTERTDVPFHGQFKPWHFIDLGLEPGDPAPSFAVTDPLDEKEGNAVQALTRAVAVLRGGSDPLITNEPTALAMVIHLVGDIHQPLHASTYYFPGRYEHGHPATDAGGNHVTVVNAPKQPGRLGDHGLNLHSFWDEGYRAGFREGMVALDFVSYVPPHDFAQAEPYRFDEKTYAPAADVSLKPDFAAWALESNQLAKDDVYGALTFTDGHRKTYLSEEYVEKSREVARRRIELAGYRLAELLNEIFAGPR